jgi:hypothetical protein
MQAEARQFGRSDVVPNGTRRRGRRQHVLEQAAQLLVRPSDLIAAVQQRGQLLGAVPAPVVADQRVGGEHRLEPPGRIGFPVPERGQILQMPGDMPLVPRDEDGLDVGEVLVERRPTDAGPVRDLRHGHREDAAIGSQRPGGVQDGVADGPPVLLDRLAPQPWHCGRIRCDARTTHCLDKLGRPADRRHVPRRNPMTDPRPDGEARPEAGAGTPPGMPRWVKVAAAIAGLLLLLFLVLQLTGVAGEHGPGMHSSAGRPAAEGAAAVPAGNG